MWLCSNLQHRDNARAMLFEARIGGSVDVHDEVGDHAPDAKRKWFVWAFCRPSALTAVSPDKGTLVKEVAAWHRNKNHTKANNWRFTTADARIKLKRLYPQFE